MNVTIKSTSWSGYELVLGTSWLGYELAWYDLARVRVDWHPDNLDIQGSQVLSCSNDIEHPNEPVCRCREAIVEPVGLRAFTTSARSSRIWGSSTKYTGSARVATVSSSSRCRFDLSPF